MQKGMRISFTDRWLLWGGIVLIACLLVKFFWPLFAYDLPLGYDAGLYRYLFIKHAQGFPPFAIATMDPWALEHPLGLFIFSSLFIKAGVPADWFIGWIWNLFPVILAVALAAIHAKRSGMLVGLFALIGAVLSIAYFDGFAAMYWKTFVSLLWCVLTFSALEKRSWWAVLFGILAVATHQQTGLLFGLTLVTWIVLPLLSFAQSTHGALSLSLNRKTLLYVFGAAVLMLLAGAAVYLPVWKEAVLPHLPALLGQTEAASGSFPPLSYYLHAQIILLAFGVYGFLQNVRSERWTPWQIAVLWSAIFVVLRLIFYRRFFLQLDFFLLPFAGIGMADLWKRFSAVPQRAGILALILIQAGMTIHAITRHVALMDADTFADVVAAADVLPADATVIGLENDSTVLLRGWLPEVHVTGPGLFEQVWTYEEWEEVLLGDNARRKELLRRLHDPAYVFVTPYFRGYYGEYAEAFLRDPCFQATDNAAVLRVVCTASDS